MVDDEADELNKRAHDEECTMPGQGMPVLLPGRREELLRLLKVQVTCSDMNLERSVWWDYMEMTRESKTNMEVPENVQVLKRAMIRIPKSHIYLKRKIHRP